jgi:hypothetical protein
MNVNKSLFFFLICLSLLIGIIAWSGIRLYTVRSDNLASAQNSFSRLQNTVVSSYLARGSFSSDFFSTQVKEFVSEHNRLQAVAIYSPREIQYLFAVHPSFFSGYPKDGQSWEKPPQLQTRPFFDLVLTSPLNFSNREDLIVSSTYNIVTTNELFQVLRDAAIAVLALIILTIIFLLIISPKPAKRKRTETEPAVESVGSYTSSSVETGTQDISPSEEEFLDTETDETEAGEAEPVATPEEQGQPAADSKGLFSPYSGLGWQEYLENRLSFELRRAASFDQDLVLLLLSSPTLMKGQPHYRLTADTIIDFFTFQDLTFEYKNNGFAIILPNMELDQGIQKSEAFLKKLHSQDETLEPKFSVGLSARNGRLLNGGRLLHEAEKALEKAESHEGNQIIGFRSDPVKYRKYIASKM